MQHLARVPGITNTPGDGKKTMKNISNTLLLGAGCICIMLLSAVSPAMAIDLYGFGSYWDKGDAEGTWGAGIGLTLPLFTEHIRLDGRLYSFENSTLGNDDELTLIPVDLGMQVHLMPDAGLNPYVLGGVSYIYADADRTDADSSIGGYLGGGLEADVLWSTIKLFGEIVYRFQEVDAGRHDDIDLSGMTGNVGMKINF